MFAKCLQNKNKNKNKNKKNNNNNKNNNNRNNNFQTHRPRLLEVKMAPIQYKSNY